MYISFSYQKVPACRNWVHTKMKRTLIWLAFIICWWPCPSCFWDMCHVYSGMIVTMKAYNVTAALCATKYLEIMYESIEKARTKYSSTLAYLQEAAHISLISCSCVYIRRSNRLSFCCLIMYLFYFVLFFFPHGGSEFILI